VPDSPDHTACGARGAIRRGAKPLACVHRMLDRAGRNAGDARGKSVPARIIIYFTLHTRIVNRFRKAANK
jgi:hypothetical protein